MISSLVVLLPTATVEDFPARLPTADARSLLAAATAAMDPRLIDAAGVSPQYSRADLPPSPVAGTLFLSNAPADKKLPEGFADRVAEAGGWLVSAADRNSLIAAIDALIDNVDLSAAADVASGHAAPTPTHLGPADFYAAGYVWLQIQIMTRRLRYTSNLDVVQLQNRLVASSQAFVAGDFRRSAEVLHEIFDALAEERDHYFSSDPHLIDLTLVSAAVLPRLAEQISVPSSHPASVLLGGDCVLDSSARESLSLIADAIADGRVDWAGGGPPPEIDLAMLPLDQAEDVLRQWHGRFRDAIGSPPPVYGRLSGPTPGDLCGALAKLDYAGIVPIDFTSGVAIGDESKIRVATDSGELEALVATPIDAADDASFLNLGPRLGGAIDGGEIATAVLVHWPGTACDSMQDVVRAARWGTALGRFWSISDYFRGGQRPYHHGTLPIVPSDADLGEWAESNEDPIGQSARQFVTAVQTSQQHLVRSILSLVHASIGGPTDPSAQSELANVTAASLGAILASDDTADGDLSKGGAAKLLFNPNVRGRRVNTSIAVESTNKSPASNPAIYAGSVATRVSGAKPRIDITADVPAGGFLIIRGGNGSVLRRGNPLTRLFGKPKSIASIADKPTLSNEFLEVAISPTGGLAGLYSGAQRGNRLSMRLECVVGDGPPATFEPPQHEIVECSPARGSIRQSGLIAAAATEGDGIAGRYEIVFTLERGARDLKVAGSIELSRGPNFDASAGWQNYIAARFAMPDDTASIRYGVRDKWHRSSARRVTAPYGYLIEDPDRQTVIATAGHALHRRVGERFIDTLLCIGNNRASRFEFAIGCDVPHAMVTAIDAMTAPIVVPILPHQSLPETGYLCHVSGRDVVVRRIDVVRDSEKLIWRMHLLATRAQSSTATLRFCREVESIQSLPSGEAIETTAADADAWSIPIAGHATRSVEIVFA